MIGGGIRLTIDDVEDFPEESRFELLDGKIVRPPPPFPIHQIHLADVMFALDAHVPRSCMISHRQAVLLDRHNMPFVDVAAIRVEAALTSPVPAVDVLVAVEVLSDWSESTDRALKKQLYARAAIPAYWLVDPLGDSVTVTQFRLDRNGHYRGRLHCADVAVIDQPWPVTLDLSAMTRTRNRIRAAARSDG
ncbi:Uma2 family endonuclease [Paractinoplanes lichenicola]|uniref:Uma2 family endonuclease n=1 Tax=Paractinoplanes lichenicola TaxID=2802976 RepID=A0ABS1W5L7_9ACTN|nr:Uma2 family endonuclease [Actinoplanes lichenicola]MBL7262019.1 Uma2 family endonuclease [Actinoplanes lichenicola]